MHQVTNEYLRTQYNRSREVLDNTSLMDEGAPYHWVTEVTGVSKEDIEHMTRHFPSEAFMEISIDHPGIVHNDADLTPDTKDRLLALRTALRLVRYQPFTMLWLAGIKRYIESPEFCLRA